MSDNSVDKAYIDKWLEGVERGPNAPLVASRYGFNKIELNGKTYLEARTKEQLIELLSQSKDPEHIARLEALNSTNAQQVPDCYYVGGGYICEPGYGCSTCGFTRAPGGGWDCWCRS